MERCWYLIDAEGKVLGRIATRIATLLMGKGKPEYRPNMDCGDFVVVINAEKVKVTGNKMEDKLYRKHTGYLGGLKEIKLKNLLAKKPERVIEFAVKGMLPKNRLAENLFKKLKVYSGSDHPYASQNPTVLT
ncbi:MAG: 50S ribosomal protein L13 [Candidatus Ratteibacteria bacterium]|jgi:large subunit ribosomal protein L13